MDNKERITIEKLKEKLFGKVWQSVLDTGLPTGSFLLDDIERKVLCDGTACELLGLTTHSTVTADYDTAKGVLDRLNELHNDGLPLDVCFIQDLPEGFTAAMVTLNELAYRNSSVSCGLLNQSELFAALGEERGRALMLTKILGTEGSYAARTYCISSAIDAIAGTLPEGSLMAQRTEDEIWILLAPGCEGPLKTAEKMRLAVENCKLQNDLGLFISEHHYLSLMTGVCAEDMIPSYMMHAATFALYQTMANGKAGEDLFRQENYTQQNNEYGDMVKFSKLLDQNLFVYHFQPIVSARTGDVVAYEALMRTKSEIGLNPLEILDLASRYGRLYDIELATLKNTMSVLSEHQSYFENRHLFINAISSHLLTEEDFREIKESYGELMEKVVIELTEQSELDDDSLSHAIGRIQAANMQLAIDDYGTGYSNTSNLLRYRPQVVKLDRSLIADIDRNPRMQKLVSGVIDFLHSSGMLALGEGVETIEEIRTLINMSVDLLQGYYVSRPKPVFVNSISEDVKQEIVNINLEAAGLVRKIYHAADGETVEMQDLALEKYTDIFIEGGDVTLIGSNENLLKLPITFSDNAKGELILKNVAIEAKDDEPAIALGSGCDVRIVCENRNILDHSGIYVPEGAKLTLSGPGDLSISPEAHDSYAIGGSPLGACGEILIDMSGRLEMNVNGENGVGIGGGHSGDITIEAGMILVNCTNGNCVGIGTFSGDANIDIKSCALSIKAAAGVGVCMGSMQGCASIRMKDLTLDCNGSGNKLCGIGSLEGSRADIMMNDLKLYTVMRGKEITSIGTYGSETYCDISHASLNLYAEGGRVSGIGDKAGGGNVKMRKSEINITFLTGDGFALGSPNGILDDEGVIEHIKLND